MGRSVTNRELWQPPFFATVRQSTRQPQAGGGNNATHFTLCRQRNQSGHLPVLRVSPVQHHNGWCVEASASRSKAHQGRSNACFLVVDHAIT